MILVSLRLGGRHKLRSAAWLAAGIGLVALAACSTRSPLAAVEEYARAVYARDYASAYDYLSVDDQAVVSKEAYIAQYESFEGAQLEIARRLAARIEFQNPQVTETGDSAMLTVQVRVPDGNASAVAEILDEAGKEGADIAALRAKLDELIRSGQLPFLEGDQTFELQRAGGRWGVDLRLREAAFVSFTAGVQAGLPWEFEPLQSSARLLLGDLVHVQYRVKNLSNQTLTGKADEDTLPEALADHLYFLQCFCMLQLTLDPGEEQILTITVTLTEPLPAGKNELEVHYDFYPLEAFPESEEEMPGVEFPHVP
jgi:hypothetical protein